MDYDWRDDLGMVEMAMPPASHLHPAVRRLRSHFEAVERRAIDATGMLDKVKETVTKAEVRRRVIQATRTDLDRLTLRADLSDAMWLEELADAAMNTRVVRLALRLAPRAASELGQTLMEPTRFEVVEAERDPKRPPSDAVEAGDWTLHLNTVGFEHTPDGAFLAARIVSERVVPTTLSTEAREELERIDADIDRRAREAFLASPTIPAPLMHSVHSHNHEIQTSGRCTCATCPRPEMLIGLGFDTKGK